MANHATLTIDNDTAFIEGEVDFSNVVMLSRQGSDWLRQHAPTVARLDLSRLRRCNSAATTLLLGWLRTANAAGKTLSIHNIPGQLRSLMDLGGLEHLLPTE